jgi:hypothetical protein
MLDERNVWWRDAIAAAERFGYTGRRIASGVEVRASPPGSLGFIRPHADWRILPVNQSQDWPAMSAHVPMVQDAAQVEVYESKSEQFRRWARWMPATWRFTELEPALALAAQADYPLVSKADVGASSVNVRILANRAEAEAHLRALFGPGVPVSHGAEKAPKTTQRGYALLQRFIPHTVTWRVNAIGRARAVFKRYCYPDRPVAQTGNVEPADERTPGLDSLLAYADQIFEAIGTRWCALDILQDGDQWTLLETSLAWPWPSPGRCNEGPIFRSPYRWIQIWDAMFAEAQAGAFSAASPAAVSCST